MKMRKGEALPVFSHLNRKGVEVQQEHTPEGAKPLHKMCGSFIRRTLKKGGISVLCDAKPLYFVQQNGRSIPYFNCLIPGSGWNVVALTSLVKQKEK